jgi:hypothetical protein
MGGAGGARGRGGWLGHATREYTGVIPGRLDSWADFTARALGGEPDQRRAETFGSECGSPGAREGLERDRMRSAGRPGRPEAVTVTVGPSAGSRPEGSEGARARMPCPRRLSRRTVRGRASGSGRSRRRGRCARCRSRGTPDRRRGGWWGPPVDAGCAWNVAELQPGRRYDPWRSPMLRQVVTEAEAEIDARPFAVGYAASWAR